MWKIREFWGLMPKEPMNSTKKKDLHPLQLQSNLLAIEFWKIMTMTHVSHTTFLSSLAVPFLLAAADNVLSITALF